jgi:leucyl aminopeptidase (aminopeptidase T)
MDDLNRPARLIVELGMQLKPEENFLIIADSYPLTTRFAQHVFNVANSMIVETTLAIMTPRKISGQEPPSPITAAMKSADAVLYIVNDTGLGHTNARIEANNAGARVASFYTEAGEEYLYRLEFTEEDIEEIANRTLRLAEKLSEAKSVRVTSAFGTDIIMSLEGRNGNALYPCAGGDLFPINPEFGEAMICPIEGTAEGIIVIDVEMCGWKSLLKSPLRLVVRNGKIVDVDGTSEEVKRLNRIIHTDSNANNIAEFAIGTSHKHPKIFRGFRMEQGRLGYIHIGFGRNTDIGGNTHSKIHLDGLMSNTTVELDGKCLVDNGKIMV